MENLIAPAIVLSDLLIFALVFVMPFYKEKKYKKALSWLIGTGIVYLALTIYDSFVGIAACTLISGITLFLIVIKHLFKVKKTDRYDVISIVIAYVFTIIYLGYSAYVANDLKVTEYSFDVGSDLRIVQISDIHYGSFGNTDKLKEIVNEANAQHPDVIVLTGDIVDENTSVERLHECFSELSNLNARLGVYYVIGNHDNNIENYSLSELFNLIENYGITPLKDKCVILDENYVLFGLSDSSVSEEISVDKIASKSGVDLTGYKAIVLKHQPSNYAGIVANEDVDIELVLSGHTHGGQMFPVNVLYKLSSRHADDLMYGTTELDGIDFVVSSGATGGEMPFKNMTISEIVVIDLH